MSNQQKESQRGLMFLFMSLLAFSGLGLEMLLAFFIEPKIYKISLNQFSSTQVIMHWVITCVMWLIIALMLITVSKKKLHFNVFSLKNKLRTSDWIICLLLLVVSITFSVYNWNGLKVLKEFSYNGWLKFLFQYIYYAVETILVVLIIVFGQKAGELWFKNPIIPWGGIIVALTWGLVHMVTKGSLENGFWGLVSGLMYGIVYLVCKKNLRLAVPFIFLMFVL